MKIMKINRGNPTLAGVVALLSGLAVGSCLSAQEVVEEASRESVPEVDFGTGGWTLNPYSGQLNDEPEFGPERDGDQFANDAIYGLRGGYVLERNVFFEGDVAVSFPELQPRDGGARIPSRTFLFAADAGYNFQPTQRLQIFVNGGAEAVVWDTGDFDTESNFALRYGTGARYYLAPNVAVRGDVRWHQVLDALQETRATALGVATAAEEDLWALELSAGVSIFLGGPRDTDGDGVYDEVDACAGTPVRVIVDETGCPVDGDDDGVPDGLDRCPDTPAGATIDPDGCPIDSDGDRVLDGLDECPNTPARATVDARGCSGDSDSDGVLNGLDECPNTPQGAEVDEVGCPTGVLGVTLRDFVSQLDRLTVWFDLDSAELWEDSRPTLDLLGEGLVHTPALVVEVQGHTDAAGSEQYNEMLSAERAAAVRDYLLENFPEIEEDQITTQAVGETEPVAPNDPAAGRQRNRRAVVLVVEPRVDN